MVIYLSAVTVLGLMSFAQAAPPVKCDDPDYDRKHVAEKLGKPIKIKVPGERNEAPPSKKQVVQVELDGKKIPITIRKYSAHDRPKQGTAIFLCGGPGVACSQSGPPESMPSTFDVVTFDYVGIGDNRAQGMNGEVMSLEAQGSVTAQLVKKLELKDYILYGNSLGTAVATIAGEELTKGGSVAPKPKALILEGTIGKAGTYAPNMQSVGDRAWALLKPTEQKSFLSTYEKTAKGLSPTSKLNLDNSLMLNGAMSGAKGIAKSLREFSKNAARLREEAVMTSTQPTPESEMKAAAIESHHYRSPGCQVNVPDANGKDVSLFEGRVTVNLARSKKETQSCDCPLVKRPFDSAAHQVKGVPIIYISGQTDMMTPPEDTAYHMKNQKGTEQKILFSIPDGGHGEMMGGLLSECSPEVIVSAVRGDIERLRKDQKQLELGKCPGVQSGPAAGARITR